MPGTETDVLETITSYIEQQHLLPEKGQLIVAVSGGADSLCLLHLLHRLCGSGKRYPEVQLHVAHLNHQLRGEAGEQDAASVTRLAESWGLAATLGCVDVPALARREQRSLEDAARTARYRFLREVAQGQPIAVAHHKDDQVETLLLHWLRGGGLASMVGLQPLQQDIIRPLLCLTHADTLIYCYQHNLEPLEDASNNDPRFLRNRIRHELVPLLASMNPGIRETLLRNSEVMQTDFAWIEANVDTHWPAIVSEEQNERIKLRVPALLTLPLSLQRHLLRRVTARLNMGQSALELRHYRLIEHLLQHEYHGETLTLHLPQHIHAIRQGDTLVFECVTAQENRPASLSPNAEVLLPIPGHVAVPGTPWITEAEPISGALLSQVRIALSREDWTQVWRLLPSSRYTVYIDAASLRNEDLPLQEITLRVRTRWPGDRMQPLGMSQEKKVQDVLVDRHIPRIEREQIPIFFSSKHCIWLAGVHLDDRARLTHTTQEIVRLSITQASKQEAEQTYFQESRADLHQC